MQYDSVNNDWAVKAGFLQALFDAVPSFVFIVDDDVRVFHLNSAALSLLGGNRDSVLMKRGGDLLHCINSVKTPEGCGRSAACVDCVIRNSVKKAFLGKKTHREITRLELIDGTGSKPVYFMVTTSPFSYDGKNFALLVMEDVTEAKIAEQELLNAKKALEARTSELSAANQELESFSYSVSHDLRAPLRHVTGFVELLQRRMGDKLDQKSIHYMETIKGSSKKMEVLIDDLLDFSRIGRGDMRMSNFSMNELLHEEIASIREHSNGRNIEWQIDDLPEVLGDPSMLRLVIVNLLLNAVKFTQKRSKAEISIGCKEAENEYIFFIKDNGVGFDMQHAGQLFGAFKRLHSKSEFDGTGIGLANVRRIITRHGGRTWAEGVEGQGATFYFSLPKRQ